MKINWFQVKNFRSIVDSGRCYVDPRLTVLAGKNEAGKTNMLRALEWFNTAHTDERPLGAADKSPTEVTVSYNIGREVLSEWPKLEDEAESYELVLTRTKDGLFPSGAAYDAVAKAILPKIASIRERIVHNLTDLGYKGNANEPSDRAFIQAVEQWCQGLPDVLRAHVVSQVQAYLGHIKYLYYEENPIFQNISNHPPKFVFFDSFQDTLPDGIELDAASIDSNGLAKHLFELAGVSVEPSREWSIQDKKRITDNISKELSKRFNAFYKQASLKIEASLEGKKLELFVYDQNKEFPFKPAQRSKGLQWFLSFLISLDAVGTENQVILIDEPGLYLHAKAQEDVLRFLEKLSERQQIMMTTHSPYLIDPSRLERIRLVLRDDNGRTVVENKIHKGAEKDTMKPIITAIGLDIANGLTFSEDFNVLVEGISDYYYLEAMKKYLEDSLRFERTIRFIPNVGASQVPNMAALLIGWGIDFKVALDRDKEGKATLKKLQKLDIAERVEFVHSKDGYAIEDLFSTKDFATFVLLAEENTDKKNSALVKEGKLDKVLLAKNFNIKIHNSDDVQLEAETVERFSDLFKRLASKDVKELVAT